LADFGLLWRRPGAACGAWSAGQPRQQQLEQPLRRCRQMFRGERGILQVSRPRRRPSRPMVGLAVVRRMLRLVVGCVQTSSAEPGWYLRVVICQWHKQADLFGSGAAASCLPAGHGNFSALVGSVGPSLRRVQHCDWPVPPTTQCPGGGTGRTTPASCSISHCLAPFLGGFGGAGAPGR